MKTWIFLLISATFLPGCTGLAAKKPPLTPEERLDQAQTLIDKDKPAKAAGLLKEWIKENPESPALEQAYNMQAQAEFNRGHYYQSFEAYEKLIDKFNTSKHFATAVRQEVEIAKLFLAGKKRLVWGFIPAGAKTEGVEILDKVAEHWPGSELGAEALMIQGDYWYGRGRFMEAQQSYQLVANFYIKSSHFERALLRNAEATHAQYRGTKYDSRCLGEARVRYEQYRARFPERARQLGIDQRIEMIDYQLGEKTDQIARFYRRTHKDSAAEYYWKDVQRHWPASPWSQIAQENLQKSP